MYRDKDKFNDFENDYKIERLLDEIEEKQAQQIEVINQKNQEINDLIEENKRLNYLLSRQDNDINFLNNEIERLKGLLVSNEQKFRIEMEEKISELYAIMEISKKIDDQNKEIEDLEKINQEQMKKFKEFGN